MSGRYKFGNNSLIKNPFQVFFRSYGSRIVIGADGLAIWTGRAAAVFLSSLWPPPAAARIYILWRGSTRNVNATTFANYLHRFVWTIDTGRVPLPIWWRNWMSGNPSTTAAAGHLSIPNEGNLCIRKVDLLISYTSYAYFIPEMDFIWYEWPMEKYECAFEITPPLDRVCLLASSPPAPVQTDILSQILRRLGIPKCCW